MFSPVAASGRQGSQVISRSENPQSRSPDALFVLKYVDDFFSRRPQNTGRRRRWLFHCQNKTNKAVRYGNIFTALHGMQTRSSDENSVSPSVRPSVKRVHCDKTEERYVHTFIPYQRSFSLVFWEEE